MCEGVNILFVLFWFLFFEIDVVGEGRLINKVSRSKSKPIAIGNNKHSLFSPPSLRQLYLIGLKVHIN